jgi:anti-anti-sigma factor
VDGWGLASLCYHWEDIDVLVIRVSGEIDMSNVDDFRRKITHILRPATRCIVFELSEVEFIDSSGLRMLAGVATDVGMARLRAPSRVVRRIVELTGIGALIPTEECLSTEP